MFSKLILASSAFLTSEAVNLRVHDGFSFNEQCGSNILRHKSKHETQDFYKYSSLSQQYEDPDFPANESSLFWRQHLRDQNMPQTYINEVTGWARPSEMVDSPSLWGSQGVQPTGTQQGLLGDCWFLASAAALAEHPDRIKQIFTNIDYDSAGIFQVTFYDRGNPVKITVDDRLPVKIGTRQGYTDFGIKSPVNSRMSKNGAWWIPILEKAFAKFNVNYAQLNYGDPGVALRQLTGMPEINFKAQLQTEDEFYKIVNEADQKNWAVTATCTNQHASLVINHAYTLLGVVQLEGGPKLVKLRNPWGSETYTGPYNDSDSQWTAAQKAQVNLQVANDGIFYTPVSDFKIAFTDYSILMYQDWQYKQMTTVTGTGQKSTSEWGDYSTFMRYFTSDVDQNVLITFEYQQERQIETGCPKNNLFLNFYIDGGSPNVVSSYTGYGFYRMDVKAGAKHSFNTYNWADTSLNVNFDLTLFAENGAVNWSLE